MMYFANPCGPLTQQAMLGGLLGFIDTPAQGNQRDPEMTWCADNGCFGKGYPGDFAWLRWLAHNRGDVEGCTFATAPDVVGDAEGTLIRSTPWLGAIRSLGYPAALVAQNGLSPAETPWSAFDVLFVGGCVECPEHGPTLEATRTGSGRHQKFFCPTCQQQIFDWKLGPAARELVAAAKAHGKWVHMGRVNSGLRLRYAAEIGCDSADGTYLTFGPRKNLPILLGWLEELSLTPPPAAAAQQEIA